MNLTGHHSLKPAVLVPAAHAMGPIGVIRSLGRAGYVVHAAASSRSALGLRSKFATHSTVYPSVNDPNFVDWFKNYIRTHDIQLIIPGGGLSLGSHPVLDDYAHLFPTSHKPNVLAQRNKYQLFETLAAGTEAEHANLPPYILIDLEADLPRESDLAALGSPLFVKREQTYAIGDQDSDVDRLPTPKDTLEHLRTLQGKYKKVLVQGFAPGMGTGVFFLRWNGEIHAKFMHLRLHEMPHTGGASSLRKSWWHQAMADDAQAKIERIGWEGVSMVEYRWNPRDDKFYLMEMNLRFWGSLHLAIAAGVDFPKLLADAFFGSLPEEIVVGRGGVICRNTIPFELGYLVSLWRDSNVSVGRKIYSLIEAMKLTADPRVKSDLWFPGDRSLYWLRLREFLLG